MSSRTICGSCSVPSARGWKVLLGQSYSPTDHHPDAPAHGSAERGELTATELRTPWAPAPGNAPAMCKALKRRASISRAEAPDERIVLIALTPQGTGLLRLIENELSSMFDPVLQGFSPADFEQIIDGMEKLKTVVTSLYHAFENTHGRR